LLDVDHAKKLAHLLGTDETGTLITAVLGIEAITVKGTEFGTSVH